MIARNVSRYFAALRRLTGYRISSCNAAVFCEGNEARLCTAIFVHNGSKNVSVQREKSRCIYTRISTVRFSYSLRTCSEVDEHCLTKRIRKMKFGKISILPSTLFSPKSNNFFRQFSHKSHITTSYLLGVRRHFCKFTRYK